MFSSKTIIYIDVRPDSGSTAGFGILHSDRNLYPTPEKDFFINIHLKKTNKIIGHVDIKKDEKILPIHRQLINPFFIEYEFFDTIKRNKTNKGSDLTIPMISHLKTTTPEIQQFQNPDVVDWFDYSGRLTLSDTYMDNLDKISLVWENIISKSKYFSIIINK